jgi:hypothetical protein
MSRLGRPFLGGWRSSAAEHSGVLADEQEGALRSCDRPRAVAGGAEDAHLTRLAGARSKSRGSESGVRATRCHPRSSRKQRRTSNHSPRAAGQRTLTACTEASVRPRAFRLPYNRQRGWKERSRRALPLYVPAHSPNQRLRGELKHHPGVGSAARVSSAIEVALLVLHQSCIIGICPVGRVAGESVGHALNAHRV